MTKIFKEMIKFNEFNRKKIYYNLCCNFYYSEILHAYRWYNFPNNIVHLLIHEIQYSQVLTELINKRIFLKHNKFFT